MSVKVFMHRVGAALTLVCLALPTAGRGAEEPKGPADLIVHHAKVVTVDEKFTTAEAVAVKDGRIVAVGDDDAVLKLEGAEDARDRRRRPHRPARPVRQPRPPARRRHQRTGRAAAESAVAQGCLRLHPQAGRRRRRRASGSWCATPSRRGSTRRRFPTKAELDEAAPEHPVLYHAGPAGIVNSLGLKVSGITKDTPNPPAGIVVKDPTTGEPTGMLRNAYRVLKGVPRDAARLLGRREARRAEETLPPLQRAGPDQHRRPQRRPRRRSTSTATCTTAAN